MNQEQSAKYNFSLILLVILLTGLIVGSGVYLWQKSYNKKLQAQNQQLQQEINELQDKVNELQNQIAQLQGQQGTQKNGEEPISPTEIPTGTKISLKSGDNFDFVVVPDKGSFDLSKKTFMGDIEMKNIIVFTGIKFIVTDNTQIFRAAVGDKDLTGPWREYFSFSELRDMSGTELFYGVPRPFAVRIIGKVLTSEKGKIVVRADKIARYVQ